MKYIIRNLIFVTFLLCSLVQFSQATNTSAVDELINSYSYNFTTEAIEIESFQDSVIDTNSDGISDILRISIQTSQKNSDYITILTLNDEVPNIKYQYLTNETINFDFETVDLNQNQFNYTLEIRDSDFSLLHRSNNILTNYYQKLERGIKITNATISQQNNKLFTNIEFQNISTFDIETKQIIIELEYNNQSYYIESNTTFTNTENIIKNFSIPEDIIKKSHIKGNFKIKNIYINQKKFELNYTSQLLNFVNFVNSPYIQSTNSIIYYDNNLIDYIEVEINLINQNYSNNQNFNLTFQLIDDLEIILNNLEDFEIELFMNQENNRIKFNISNEDLYFHKINSKVLASYILLKNNEGKIIDSLENINLTNEINFQNVKRPDLPDLKVSLNPIFNKETKSTNLSIIVENIGNLSAYNVELNVFGEDNQDKIFRIPFLENNSKIIFEEIYNNLSKDYVFTAIIDLKNHIDEENETNNIYQIKNYEEINFSSKILILNQNLIEIEVSNTGNDTIYNLNLNLNNITKIENIILKENETKTFLIEVNLALNKSNYITIFKKDLKIEEEIVYFIPNLEINSKILDINEEYTILEREIVNINNFSFSFKFSEEMIKLSKNKSLIILEKIPTTNKSLNEFKIDIFNFTFTDLIVLESKINLSTQVNILQSPYLELEIKNTEFGNKNIKFKIETLNNKTVFEESILVKGFTTQLVVFEHNLSEGLHKILITQENSTTEQLVYIKEFSEEIEKISILDNSLLEFIFKNPYSMSKTLEILLSNSTNSENFILKPFSNFVYILELDESNTEIEVSHTLRNISSSDIKPSITELTAGIFEYIFINPFQEVIEISIQGTQTFFSILEQDEEVIIISDESIENLNHSITLVNSSNNGYHLVESKTQLDATTDEYVLYNTVGQAAQLVVNLGNTPQTIDLQIGERKVIIVQDNNLEILNIELNGGNN